MGKEQTTLKKAKKPEMQKEKEGSNPKKLYHEVVYVSVTEGQIESPRTQGKRKSCGTKSTDVLGREEGK